MAEQQDMIDRETRIAEIRRQIADGTYETPEKLATAIDALCERLSPSKRHAGLRRSPLRET